MCAVWREDEEGEIQNLYNSKAGAAAATAIEQWIHVTILYIIYWEAAAEDDDKSLFLRSKQHTLVRTHIEKNEIKWETGVKCTSLIPHTQHNLYKKKKKKGNNIHVMLQHIRYI